MAQADTIKEFLVSLGFSIDAAGERRFVDSIGAATVKAVALGAAVTGAATAVVAGVARIADNLEQLYFASQRTNASVENLQSLGFAAKQMGVDAGTALGAVESLARFLRNSPGGEGLLKNLGVQTRDANGQMRDTVDLMDDLGKTFADMPYYKAHAFAQALGIDEKTLMAMRQGMGEFEGQYKGMLRSAGVDSQAAAKSSHEFMVELRLMGASIGILAMKVASSLTGNLGTNIRRLRENFVANFDQITNVISAVVGWIMHAADAVASLAIRGAQALGWLIDWFNHLSPVTQNVIESFGAILVAWRVLNAGFMATPLGMILALGVGLLALLDDYKTWKEGGKSLIDWGKWEPEIRRAIAGIKELSAELEKLGNVLGPILKPAMTAIAHILSRALKDGFANVLDIVILLTDILTGKWADAGARAMAIMSRIGNFAKYSLAEVGKAVVGVVGNTAESMAGEAHPSGNHYVSGKITQGSGPRGIRNNNPGNIEFGSWASAHGATGKESAGRFARFGSAQDGLNALAELIENYMGRGINTIGSIIAKYAPASENNTAAYVASVAKRLGIDANAHLDPRNVQQMAGMVDAIVRVENGSNPYSKEMIQSAAARGVSMSQNTNINIHGSGDSKAMARDVAQAQNEVNGQMLRNTRGAILQ